MNQLPNQQVSLLLNTEQQSLYNPSTPVGSLVNIEVIEPEPEPEI